MKLSEHIQLSKRSVKYLFSLSRTYTVCLILNSVINGILPYVPIWFSARLVDALYERAPLKTLALYASLTVGIVFLLNLINAYISSRRYVANESMYRNEDWNFSQKTMQMAYASIEDPDVALLRERIKGECQTGYNLFRLYFGTERMIHYMTQIAASVSMTMSFFFLESIPPSMKLAFAGAVCLTALCGILTTGRARKLDDHFMGDAVKINILLGKYYDYQDNYGNGKDIRIYDMAKSLLGFISNIEKTLHQKAFLLNMKVFFLQLEDTALNHILKIGSYLLLLYAALFGDLPIGSIAQYVSCLMLFLEAVSQMANCVQTSLGNHKYLKRYFSYLDIPNNMYQGTLTVEKRDDCEYFVEFRDVSFRYPNTESYALRHVSLKYKIGEKLAVVGMNGSGKTTFIKLMCRLYDPTEGEILLNGVNIQKYDYDEYMSIFSVVFQDFQLFSFSLGQNVAAASEYEEEKVKKALKQAGMEEQLSAMPSGTKTCLYKDFDKDGIEISGGEAQKIALARALYKDAPFLILDEPTAALDPISEYEVYSKFNEIAGVKTAIYISHRLASCRFCDKIAVFHKGEIVQSGSHESLLAQKDGKYYELWHAQAQYYT